MCIIACSYIGKYLFWFAAAFVFKQGNDSLCLEDKGNGKLTTLSLSLSLSLSLLRALSLSYTGFMNVTK